MATVPSATINSEFPLEQLVQLGSTRFQKGFARQVIREASHLRPFSAKVTLLASDEGLLLHAENEAALEPPAEVLRDIYKEALRVSAPKVRYLSLDRQRYEPIMLLRVRVADSDLGAVYADLATRDATVLEADFSRGECVLRAEVPLRKLLGYAPALAAMTRGTGLHWTWLDRYAPIAEPRGPTVA
jgi:hypothetical protein